MFKFKIAVLHRAAIFCLGSIALGACTISPLKNSKELLDQSLPSASIPEQFQSNKVAGKEQANVDDAWLKQFNDPELNALVAEALQNNPSIRIIAARRVQSEALINAAGGSQFPGINAIGNTGSKVGSSGTGLSGFYIGANWECGCLYKNCRLNEGPRKNWRIFS